MKFNLLWKKCWAKTILLSQNDMFWFFFHPFSFCYATYLAPLELF
jgi:hypothetical protein